MAPEVRFGTGKGKVFPHEKAGMLLNPLRRLVQPPGRLASQVRLEPAMRVLELGPGPGFFSVELAKRVPEGHVHLFDLQDEMLRMALHRLRDAQISNVDATRGDALSLPFRDACFDVVVLVAVLGEVPEPGECLREIHRVLAPDGTLCVSETRGDPDRIPPGPLRRLALGAGLIPASRQGWLWSYVARFRKSPG